MADELQPVETTTAVQPAEQQQTETVSVSKAEFEKMQNALKEANKEAASRRKRLEELETAESKRKEDAMSETEKQNKRIAELEAKNQKYERAEQQRKVAEKVGLPLNLAHRLIGDSEEDLEADAKALLETLPKQPEPQPEKKQPGLNPTNPGDKANASETPAQQKARLFGNQPNIWTPPTGGVIFNG